MKLWELREYKWNEHVTIADESQFKQLRDSPKKKFFGPSTGFEPVASALALQYSTSWAMKTHTLGASQFIEFDPWKERNESWQEIQTSMQEIQISMQDIQINMQDIQISMQEI